MIYLPIILAVVACTSGNVRYEQYYVQGELLYKRHCANCHQIDGSGLGLVYPPLNVSDYMDADKARIICGIRNGIAGEIVVNGNTYNQPMVPVQGLSDLEIAELTTYIYNAWGRSAGLIPLDTVRRALRSCPE